MKAGREAKPTEERTAAWCGWRVATSAACQADPSTPSWAAISAAMPASSALNETSTGKVSSEVRSSAGTWPGYWVA